MTVKDDLTGSTRKEEEERPDEDAESVFSDSEEEEGELLGGRRDVASDVEEEGDAEAHGDRGNAADGEAERLGKLSLKDSVDAVNEEGLVSEETDYEDGELKEGYESEEDEEEEAEVKEERPAHESRPARKVLEPYEVPMSGAFWMHDDRGGDDEEAGEGAEKRRPKKKLYDPDDDGEKWQHDRFDLLDMPPEFDQYRGFLQDRSTRGRGRGRRGRRQEENAPPSGEGYQGAEVEVGNGEAYNESQYGSSGRGGRGQRGGRGRGRGRGRGAHADFQQQDGGPDTAYQRAQAVDSYRGGSRGGRGRQGGRGRGDSSSHGNGGAIYDNSGAQGKGRRTTTDGRGRPQPGEKMREEWPSLPATLQASASGSKLSATAKDFTPPVSEHGAASGTPAEAAAQVPAQPGAAEQLQYRPYIPQPMPAPQVAYGVPVEPGFVPGPMQQGAAYAAEAAMQRPVKRPITIQAPSDQQQTTAAFPAPQSASSEGAHGQPDSAPQAGRSRGGRRYSAMAGSMSTS
ncbi:g2356 [Coccomyxa elongata]